MRKVKIYALVNPLNSRVFYIGATSNIDARIRDHKWRLNPNRSTTNSGEFFIKRRKLYARVLDKGMDIRVRVLEEVAPRRAAAAEKKWFFFYAKKYHLIQIWEKSYPTTQNRILGAV
jgi:predicted GIY-YIG superfamily endonuclease